MPHRTLSERSLAPTLLAFSLALSCHPLEDVERGVCGNRVVEVAEDCDSHADDPSSLCFPPGSPHECQFSCAVIQEDDEARHHCPAGFTCGSDDVCRASSGDFTRVDLQDVDLALELWLADFNGDGRKDVLSRAGTSTDVYFHDAAGASIGRFTIPQARWSPAVGQLTGDDRADFAFSLEDGRIGVMRGRDGHQMVAKAYTPYDVEAPDELRLVAIDALAESSGSQTLGDELLGLADGSALALDRAGLQPIFSLPGNARELAGDVLVGHLDAAAPCEQMILAFAGAPGLHVMWPCTDESPVEFNRDVAGGLLAQPSFVLGLTDDVVNERGAAFTHLDDDSTPDLIVFGQTAAHGALGYADGSFGSPGGSTGDGRALQLAELLGFDPGSVDDLLAVGRIDGDTSPDIVTKTSIRLSEKLGPGAAAPIQLDSSAQWDWATIADVNQNGLMDVVAFSSRAPRVELWNGTPAGLNRFDVGLGGMPELAALGDFDGDLLTDVAVSVNTGADDELVVLWGQAAGAPVRSTALTTMPSIKQLEVTHSSLRPDSIEDLIVVGSVTDESGRRPRRAAVFFGDTGRQMLAPLELGNAVPEVTPRRLSVAPMDGDENAHADVVVLSSRDEQNAIWLFPSVGEAEVTGPETWRYAELSPDLAGEAALLVSGDLEGDGLTEQVIVGTSRRAEEGFPGLLQLARVEDGEWVVGPAQVLSERFWFAPDADTSVEPWAYLLDPSGNTSTCGRSQAVLAEVDGQPGLDLVALGMVPDSVHLVLHRIVVVPGDGAGGLDASRSLQLESFVPPEPSNVERPAPGTVEPRAFALLNADSDAELEIALLDDEGVFIAELDLEERALVEPRLVGQFDFHAAPRDCTASSGGALVAGDIDSDGVDDLVVGGLDSLVTLRGRPTRE